MNLLDVVVLAGVVAATVGGFRVGFLARVASWIGIGVGFYVALRLVPTVLRSFDLPTASGRLLVTVAVLIVGTFVGQAIGLVVGHRVRGVLPIGGARSADRLIGGAAGAVSIVLALWLAVPTLADVAGWPARQARGSVLAKAVDGWLPDPPDATRSVRQLVDGRGFPSVFDALEPAPDAGLPPVDSGLEPDVVASVTAGTVKVMGEACRRIQEGSGFVISEDVVVTNAHVVAGEDDIDVVRPDGKRLRASVAVFDASRDLAVLRVDKLGLPVLDRADAKAGSTGAVFGHPGGQDAVRAAPARISDQVTADGQDIYGEPTQREVFILAANLRPGDSGGPLVDTAGRVVGVAFAIAPDRPGTAYALTGAELDGVVVAFNGDPGADADTRECLE
ncbi:MAG TPA: MarP family serine protease [Acidimicrobiales bacterium]|nr:MarP family serine protease [Acidimicrobiales bacterium]